MSADYCGSTVTIVDREARAYSVCTRPPDHDGLHGNGDLRWQQLEQKYGRPIGEVEEVR